MSRPTSLVRVALWGIGYLTVLCVTFVPGFYAAGYVRHRAAFSRDPIDPDLQAALVERGSTSEDDVTRVAAFTKYLSYLQSASLRVQQLPRSYLASDEALTLVRLASASDRLGQNELSRQNMARALELCKEMNWRICDEAKLKEGADRMDRGWSEPVSHK
jgi:hypothetical protein